eukprot:3987303-Alexandrium_andersonii.AAC.1
MLHRLRAGRCEAQRPHAQPVRPQALADGVAGACGPFPSERSARLSVLNQPVVVGAATTWAWQATAPCVSGTLRSCGESGQKSPDSSQAPCAMPAHRKLVAKLTAKQHA